MWGIEVIMNPWFETIFVLLLAFMGVLCGMAIWHLSRPMRVFGYLLPLLTIIGLIILRVVSSAALTEPLYWVSISRAKFAILSFTVPMGLIAPLPKLPYIWERFATCIITVVFIFIFSIPPFLAPALVRNDLSNIQTNVNSDGVCFQSKSYTCAPAAAVTALRKLGFAAYEGELAILSHTSPITGTLPWSLYTALSRRYSSDGLNCQYRRFDSINQLQDADITLVAVRDTLFSDHCVAVLEISEDTVTIADPAYGKTSISREHFEKIWRSAGIALKRQGTQQI
jgi:predicted double-glycine peptidase